MEFCDVFVHHDKFGQAIIQLDKSLSKSIIIHFVDYQDRLPDLDAVRRYAGSFGNVVECMKWYLDINYMRLNMCMNSSI